MGRFAAWLVWRGAYLTQTISWRNKLLIPIYWYVYVSIIQIGEHSSNVEAGSSIGLLVVTLAGSEELLGDLLYI